MPDQPPLTERQQKWFASVRAGLQRQTGRCVEEWASVARLCPHTAHRQRLAWMKAEHGLGQNHASLVLHEAFPSASSWSEPDALESALWADPAARAIFQAVRARALALPDVVTGQRRGFTAFSRRVQFAAIRPVRTGALLGLALPPAARLAAPGRQGWSERLKSCVALNSPADVDAAVAGWLHASWQAS